MPGTLTVSTLSDGTNSTSATNAIVGSAKSWINYNGSTPPVTRGSYNVSSVTRGGLGYYTVSFTTAMSDVNYSAVTSARPTADQICCCYISATNMGAYLSTSVPIRATVTNGPAAHDSDIINVAVNR